MLKVSLLGDSIRLLGYGKETEKLLGNGFCVYQPQDNCRFAKYTLRGLFDWENDMRGSRIVHWNNGLWDCANLFGDGEFSSEGEYAENMCRIADLLLERHDKVIFATTTPVSEKYPYIKGNYVIERYNEFIVELLEKKGIIINDLYTPVAKNIDKYISSEDHIHLTEEGIRLCAHHVADIIKKTAEKL